MTEDKKIKLYKDLAAFKGKDYQRYKLIEELGELIQAKVKYNQHESLETLKNLVSEIVDVNILLEQFILNFDKEPNVIEYALANVDDSEFEDYIIFTAGRLITELIYPFKIELSIAGTIFAADKFIKQKNSLIDMFIDEKKYKLERTAKRLYGTDKGDL